MRGSVANTSAGAESDHLTAEAARVKATHARTHADDQEPDQALDFVEIHKLIFCLTLQLAAAFTDRRA